jgi:hypothetical protein
MTVNSMLLDVTGILFAAQLVLLLTIGPYADYGNWRPWIMISKFRLTPAQFNAYEKIYSMLIIILFTVGQCVLYICQFAMCGISKPEQWQAAQARK